jgi:flagellar basal-body rod protein FlgF
MRVTDEPLDFAIDGDGYFGVQTAAGVRYTRNGRFITGANGMLADQLGNRVLGQNGQPIQVRPDGTVEPTALGVFNLTGVAKVGDAQFTGTVAGRGTGLVRANSLEGSGVDAARTMVEMMANLRGYEAGQKALTTIDDTLGKAAQLGSIR